MLWSGNFSGPSAASAAGPLPPLYPHSSINADTMATWLTYISIRIATLPSRVPGNAKTRVVLVLVGSVEEPARRAAASLDHQPVAAPQHAVGTPGRPAGVICGRGGVVILVVIVPAPLLHIA